MKKNIGIEELKTTNNHEVVNGASAGIGMPNRVFESETLFCDDSEIGILHQGSMYRLRVTRGGKLILNK